jgi:hypothetical protein
MMRDNPVAFAGSSTDLFRGADRRFGDTPEFVTPFASIAAIIPDSMWAGQRDRPTLVLKVTPVVLTLIPIRWENSCGLWGDDHMLKKVIAAIVLSSAVAMAPVAAFAKMDNHHHHHHHEHHHHHHHHNNM